MPLDKIKFTIKQNDTLPSLSINITYTGRLAQLVPLNLSGVSAVTFSMKDECCGYLKVSSKQAQIASYCDGTLQYNWDAEDTNEPGDYFGQFELFYTNGGKMSVPSTGGIHIQIPPDISNI